MAKIVFIGAGSFSFTRSLVKDVLTFPNLKDATLVLMDIDRERPAGLPGDRLRPLDRQRPFLGGD